MNRPNRDSTARRLKNALVDSLLFLAFGWCRVVLGGLAIVLRVLLGFRPASDRSSVGQPLRPEGR